MSYDVIDIEDMTDDLSSFDGMENFGGEFLYTGEGDDFLDFDGEVENFSGEFNIEKQFVFSVANTATVTRTAVLWAGYLKGNSTLAPGQIVDGTFNDTAGNAGLTGAATVSGQTIAEFFAYLEFNPTRIVGIKISSTSQTQIENAFTLQRLNPFRTEKSKILRPAQYQDQQVFQEKIIQFKADFQLDDQMKLTYPFVASSTTTLTWYCGASLNLAKGLAKKARKAHRNIKRVGNRAVARKNVKRLSGKRK